MATNKIYGYASIPTSQAGRHSSGADKVCVPVLDAISGRGQRPEPCLGFNHTKGGGWRRQVHLSAEFGATQYEQTFYFVKTNDLFNVTCCCITGLC